jgi:FtsP/CotA-like multicopper oxidase with cupredoxin domain
VPAPGGAWQIDSPDCEPVSGKESLSVLRIVPVYPATGELTAKPGGAPVNDRLVVLMNNAGGFMNGQPGSPDHPLAPDGDWQDTQIWELGPVDASAPTWELPFTVDPAAADQPDIGGPAFGVYRSTFFDAPEPPTIGTPGQDTYPPVHAPTFKPKNGTYERWYVANIGNQLVDENDNVIPVDMHPFHMHLVNFVVMNRWMAQVVRDADDKVVRDAAGAPVVQFVPTRRPLDFDRASRHDTVRINAHELVELWVYFPVGYKGDYPYHCHLVEHEDMGMMLHFTVV